MTGTKLLLDTNIWIDYFQQGGTESVGIIDNSDNYLFTSCLSLHEFKKKLIKNNAKTKTIEKILNFIKENSIIVNIDETIAEKASEDSIKNKIHTIDALIYRGAIENNAELVTMDYDFHKLPGVKIIKQE